MFDRLLLPPNCLNDDGLFLDNMSLEHFRLSLGKPVLVGSTISPGQSKKGFS